MGIKGCVSAPNNSVVGDHRFYLYHEETSCTRITVKKSSKKEYFVGQQQKKEDFFTVS